MFSDLKFALRQLTKAPGFTLLAVLTLALGIGLSTTIFNGVNPLLFRALPFRDPDTLVYLNESSPKQGFEHMSVAYADYAHWRRENRVFADVGVWRPINVTLGGDLPERIEGCHVSATLLSMLGINPVLGRGFAVAEDAPGAAPVVLLSHGLWQRRFGSDPAIIGQSLPLNGTQHTVIGVLPPRVRFPNDSELWIPLVVAQPETTHGHFNYRAAARLRPGVSRAQARADLDAIHARIAAESPASNLHITPIVRPIEDGFLDPELRTMGWTMLGAVAFVLAVACANVASLFVTRALARQKEFAVRAALGAGRWRTVRQLLIESLTLGLVAGVLGLFLSVWGLEVVIRLVPIEIPYWIDFSLDGRVFAFAAVISLLTSVLFGLAPAWQAIRVDVLGALNESARGSTGSRERHRLRSAFVVGEVALATLLLCGTGLMLRSLFNLQRADPGFDPARVTVFYLGLGSVGDSTAMRRAALIDNLVTDLSRLPGVSSAAACTALPLSGRFNGQRFAVEGRPPAPDGMDPVGNLRAVTPGYFAALHVPLQRGRDFIAADDAGSQKVVIIDAAFARRYFPDQDPIGQRLRWDPADPASSRVIVGIAADVKHSALDQDSRPGFYVPYAQDPQRSVGIVMRTALDAPVGLLDSARGVLRRLEPDLPLYGAMTMTEQIAETYWIRRFLGRLLVGFAALALALAAVGIASVVGYAVTQRTHEIGVRMALGATSHNILRLVLQQGLRLVALGLALGLVASVALTRLLQAQLFAIGWLDPLAIGGSTIVFLLVALIACWLPARRATRINPVEALRTE
ncbi:ABC transporter permease [Opitutus sp. ER46]|uniref:ABC transporter permease n=1 Tax=Opitutus sp. ER46 TaxID=2161864 RepID=UPI000D301A54|nr:ABC transporter permease [Opitutus sp. ER46]PTX94415.1 ABC transporter permease [Opitutus sp. ER46]